MLFLAFIGLIAGALSGYFLQELVGTVVTGGGSVNEPTAVESAVVQGLAGAASGGCLLLMAGLVKHSIHEHRSQQDKAQP